MKKTNAVAKATPKKVATKKVVTKKETPSSGKIEITCVSKNSKDMKVEMTVKGMSKIEVLECISIIGEKLVADILAEDELNNKVQKSAKKTTTKKVATKKTTTKKTK